MEWITVDGETAPRLAQTRPDPALLWVYFEQLREAVATMAQAGLVHGDLSAYNILAAGDRLVIIDLPQVVDLVGNPQGMDFLLRDLANVCGWFRSRGSGGRRARPVRRHHRHRVLRRAADPDGTRCRRGRGGPRTGYGPHHEAHPRADGRGRVAGRPRPPSGRRRDHAARVAPARARPARPRRRPGPARRLRGRLRRLPARRPRRPRGAWRGGAPAVAGRPGRDRPRLPLLRPRALRHAPLRRLPRCPGLCLVPAAGRPRGLARPGPARPRGRRAPWGPGCATDASSA